jgi:malate dehydrogenase (oxaloacetate-decarboxylating)
MEETEVFAREAAEVAMAAIEEDVARISDTWENIYNKAKKDILESRALTQDLMKYGHIPQLPEEMLKQALDYAISEVRKTQ